MENKKHNLLVIDDNHEHQRLISSYFLQNEFSVDLASDAKTAEYFLESIQYDVIIIDYVLPDKDGLALLREIKLIFPTVPVIMISAYGTERDIVAAIESGAVNYISKKPGFEQRLHDEVVNALKRKNLITVATDAENRYKQIFDAANDLIFTLDLDGKFTSFNNKCYKVLGDWPKSALGQSFMRVLPQGSAIRAQKTFQSFVIEEGNSELKNFEFYGKNGEVITLELNGSFMTNRGKITGLLVIARNVTEVKKMEKQQKKLHSHLMSRYRLTTVGKMVNGVAHSLSTPLAVLTARADILKMKYPDIEGLDEIQEQTFFMSEIIRNMITKDTLEESNIKEYWNINKILQEELKFFDANQEFHFFVKKTYDFEKNIPKIFVVYNHISQIFDILLQNAIDAMHDTEKKHLEISSHYENNQIIVKITDSGHGISEKDIPHIYEPFFTTKKTNTEKNEPTGIGLGLFHLHSIIEKYNIEISVESEVGNTTFQLKFPKSIQQ